MNNFKTYVSLAVLLVIVVLATNSLRVFNYPPRSVHQWRQSDCAAYVKTYYRTGSNLLQPATYNLAGKEGRVVSEFPVIYYLSAQIQRLTGEHYWVVRGLTFLCYLTGLFALLACIKKWLPHPFLALFPVLVLATAPYYYYYAINFLPNVPAISFSFVGLYCFLVYEERRKIITLLTGTFFFMLATALKPTDGGIVWLAYMGVVCVRLLPGKKAAIQKQNIVPLLLASAAIAISILGWTKYVNWYNDQNGNHQNLIGIYPIWDMDKDLIRYTAKRIITEWSNVFQQKLLLLVLLACLPVYLWKWRALHPFLRLFSLFILLGTGAYAILWFKAFTDHDYYQLPFVLAGVFLALTVLEYFNRVLAPRLPRVALTACYTLCAALALISIYHNRNIQQERYTNKEYTYLNPAIYEVEPYLAG